jgi:peptidoglycan hydrolase-like protein with peptidoglycan-binding domain
MGELTVEPDVAVEPVRPARRHRRRARTAVVAGATVVAVAGVTAAAIGFGGAEAGSTPRSTLPPATAKVTRITLTETEDVDGTLAYGATTTVNGHGNGTVTWLPTAGSTVDRGETLYTVDNKSVILLYGSLPLYRALSPGTEGSDVKQFEQNLEALGYKGFTVDEKYSSATATAVREWQDDLGLTRTGVVEPGQVVYAPVAIRVSEQKAQVGDAAGGPILTYTGTTREVTVALDVSKQSLVKTGTAVTIQLPGGKAVSGTVSSVGSVATTTPAEDGRTSSTTIDVTVTVADQSSLGTLDKAPVEVRVVASQRKDVLTVPVSALLALAEGGYGVQVVDGGSTKIVSVKTGLFAGGRVEVTGDGITTDTVVGVPK